MFSRITVCEVEHTRGTGNWKQTRRKREDSHANIQSKKKHRDGTDKSREKGDGGHSERGGGEGAVQLGGVRERKRERREQAFGHKPTDQK